MTDLAYGPYIYISQLRMAREEVADLKEQVKALAEQLCDQAILADQIAELEREVLRLRSIIGEIETG